MKYQISFPYLLAVATWEPRKNLGMLVRSFMALKNRGLLPRHCLVLVGGRGWKDERLAALISEGAKQAIVPLGFVPDDDLPALYAGADVFIFPSIYEGFGMPVLEARACGTRVVATNIPELREAGGLESIYVEPTLEGISEGILKASHPGSGNSFPTSTHPTWEHGGRLLAEALIGKGHG